MFFFELTYILTVHLALCPAFYATFYLTYILTFYPRCKCILTSILTFYATRSSMYSDGLFPVYLTFRLTFWGAGKVVMCSLPGWGTMQVHLGMGDLPARYDRGMMEKYIYYRTG